MSKTEIMDAIEYHNAWTKKHKEDIKKLEKARELMREVGVNTIHVDNAIEELEGMLANNIEGLAKRKKQLKLIEKLEELND